MISVLFVFVSPALGSTTNHYWDDSKNLYTRAPNTINNPKCTTNDCINTKGECSKDVETLGEELEKIAQSTAAKDAGYAIDDIWNLFFQQHPTWPGEWLCYQGKWSRCVASNKDITHGDWKCVEENNNIIWKRQTIPQITITPSCLSELKTKLKDGCVVKWSDSDKLTCQIPSSTAGEKEKESIECKQDYTYRCNPDNKAQIQMCSNGYWKLAYTCPVTGSSTAANICDESKTTDTSYRCKEPEKKQESILTCEFGSTSNLDRTCEGISVPVGYYWCKDKKSYMSKPTNCI